MNIKQDTILKNNNWKPGDCIKKKRKHSAHNAKVTGSSRVRTSSYTGNRISLYFLGILLLIYRRITYPKAKEHNAQLYCSFVKNSRHETPLCKTAAHPTHTTDSTNKIYIF